MSQGNCSNCGTVNSPAAAFCSNKSCGKMLTGAPPAGNNFTPSQPSPAPQPYHPPAHQPIEESYHQPQAASQSCSPTAPSEEVSKQWNKYNAARASLLIAAILSAINLLMGITGTNFYFLFSFAIPDVLMIFGDGFAFGIALAVTFITIFLALWLLSKSNLIAMPIAFALLSADTLIFIILFFFAISFEFDVFYLVEMGFRIWLLLSVAGGLIAYFELRKMGNVFEIPQ